ncbi:hypothetical protein M5D10_12615 [Leptospira santarosai]|uniref:hypothetical protein n=1 Tax=Leptospira santarosai TaxID=28183 RepID=UPI00062D02CC|nr:hypothetical protein [Leptospira santarosai]AVV78321.1 Uncharacterized protein XB15_00524 [Leptospira santarosai]ONF83197.1 hypothetical protein BWD13_19245 [Leptospira santarosai serovar Grippotyphosa]UZN06648.1 hypothetical protein M5D10_12615 [Leptospira santarosai]
MKSSKDQTAKTNSRKEEAAIQKRQEAYDKRYENMSPFKKKEELKSLLQKLKTYRKKIQGLISQMKKLAEQEIEVERKLKILGKHMKESWKN